MGDDVAHTEARQGAGKERRKNIERSATTRRQILEATVLCLQQVGYGAVTNIRVAEAAGVSRGAMIHHFPTRQALLVATVEYAYAKLRDYRVQRLSKFKPGLPRYRALIDLAWETAQMPEGVAVNAVRTGSRSDPEIADAVTPIMTEVADDYARMVGRHVREAGLTPDAEIQGLTATTAMSVRSLAINCFTYPRSSIVNSVLATLKGVREDIIARQLGEAARMKPPKPLAKSTPARKA